jgi:hypothetical protein
MMSLTEWERRIKLYDYNTAVDLSMHSFVPSIRAMAHERAVRLGKELGLIDEELQDA